MEFSTGIFGGGHLEIKLHFEPEGDDIVCPKSTAYVKKAEITKQRGKFK